MTAAETTATARPAGLNAFQRVVLVAGLLCMGMGQTMLFATMPPAARDLQLSELQVGLIITVSAFFFMISTPVWGRLADSWGRRPTFVFGLLSYGVTTLAFTLMLDLGYSGTLHGLSLLLALITARTGFGILTGGIQTGATAMMADSTAEDRRSSGMALVGASFGFGAVLGPALVSVLAVYGLLLPLYIVSGLTFAMGLVAWALLPETAHKHAAITRAKLSPLDARILPIMLM
jgi:MFS family permease